MLCTLILLYALDTGNIPTGCYIAAWSVLVIQLTSKIVDWLIKNKLNKE